MTGGIASYKAVTLVRMLVQAGHEVHVVPTEAALHFVGTPIWESISHQSVATSLFEEVAEVRHVELGQQADLIVVAPATANTVAKLANGIADSLLGTTILASRAPLLLAPAMHTEMWNNPATQANLDLLRARGAQLIGPDAGPLTGSDSGVGRMSEPREIAARIEEILHPHPQDFAGKRVLISAGGTQEALDPVRFLGNRSSGKQGVALAEAAKLRGAEVTLVLGTAEAQAPRGVELVAAEATETMHAEMLSRAANADVVIMAAAVADYRPAVRAKHKMHRAETGARFSLKLVANPDILVELVAARRPAQQIVGFAAETADSDEQLLALGKAKLARKGCDLLVLNRVGIDPETGSDRVFGADETAVSLLSASNATVRDVAGDKLSVAHAILDAIRPASTK